MCEILAHNVLYKFTRTSTKACTYTCINHMGTIPTPTYTYILICIYTKFLPINVTNIKYIFSNTANGSRFRTLIPFYLHTIFSIFLFPFLSLSCHNNWNSPQRHQSTKQSIVRIQRKYFIWPKFHNSRLVTVKRTACGTPRPVIRVGARNRPVVSHRLWRQTWAHYRPHRARSNAVPDVLYASSIIWITQCRWVKCNAISR